MASLDLAAAVAVATSPPLDGPAAANRRLRAIVDQHYHFLWRTLRYRGVPAELTDDCAQQVLVVVARRHADIAPGAEMSVLFSTAARVASEARRAAGRRRTTPVEDVDSFAAAAVTQEELVDERRAHQALRNVLDDIPEDIRMVFVLFEIEELTLAEIAAVVGIPQGTVASRLRRARARFQALARRRFPKGEVRPRAEGP